MARVRVFISYTTRDANDAVFAHRLATDLQRAGADVWFAEWSLDIGDSLTQKIFEAISRHEYFAIVLSPKAVKSKWVRSELSAALIQRIEKKGATILPVLHKDCIRPPEMRDLVYADFREDYPGGFRRLAKRLGLRSAAASVPEPRGEVSRAPASSSGSSSIGVLASGVKVATVRCAFPAQTVGVSVFVGAGSRSDNPQMKGISHFLMYMLFKGTRLYPTAIDIAEAIEADGGIINGYTTQELTCYWCQVPSRRLAPAMELLSDMMQRSLINRAEFERERSVIRQVLRRNRNDPSARTGQLIREACFGDRPLAWPVVGTWEAIEGLGRDDLVEHYGTWYTAPNVVLSVAGNVEHDEVVDSASRLFMEMEVHRPPPVELVRGGGMRRRVFVEPLDAAESHLGIGLRAGSRTDPDRYAVMILNAIVGRGMSSRLFKEVRERRRLASTIGSSVTRYNDTGLLSIAATVQPQRAAEATRAIVSELKKIAENPISEDELARACAYTVGSFRLSLETTTAFAQRAGEQLLMMGEIEPIERVVDKLRVVTAEGVQQAAQALFHDDNLWVAVVGPGAKEDELEEALTG